MITEFDRNVVKACKAAPVTWFINGSAKLRFALYIHDGYGCPCPIGWCDLQGERSIIEGEPEDRARVMAAADNQRDWISFDPELRAYLLSELVPEAQA